MITCCPKCLHMFDADTHVVPRPMRNKSVYQLPCECGRVYETDELPFSVRCQCGRELNA